MVTDGASALLASYNVHKCVGTDGKFDPDRIAAVIAEIGPDIIALQEADKRFGDRDALLDLDAINRATGLVPVAVQNGHSGHGWHGNLVLVREGLICALSQLRLPGLEPRGALVVDIDLVAGPVRVMAAHLGLLRHSRLLQIQALLAHATAEDGRPVVLMGDMNEWRLRKRSSLHPMRGGFAGVGDGVPSFPAYFPVLPLDRILVRPHGLLGPLEAHRTALSRVASDHLPVKARLRLGREAVIASDTLAKEDPMTDETETPARRRPRLLASVGAAARRRRNRAEARR